MNKFDDRYEIRLANVNDIDNIMLFFKENWRESHILAINRDFFEYEFCDGDDVHFIIAIERGTKSIEAIWGYYLYSKEEGYIDVAGGPWGVSAKKSNYPFLGVELLHRAQKLIKFRARIGVGDNPKSSGVFHRKIEKSYTGMLTHYYLLGNCEQYIIAKVIDKTSDKRDNEYLPNNVKIVRYDNFESMRDKFDFESYKNEIPYKGASYIRKRYFEHFKYVYQAIGIVEDEKAKIVLFFREVTYKKRKILRIIDCIGDKKYIIYLDVYLREIKDFYEYIDFYNYGIDENVMKKIGFNVRDTQDRNVIPNYFEPFLQENVDIYYSTTNENCIICKGDADQDRPNII